MPNAEFTIVLLHGTRGAAWHYNPIKRHLEQRGWQTMGIEYDDRFGNRPLDDIAQELNERCALIPGRLCIVALSQGAIIAAYALERLGLKERVACCVMLCAPLHGTLLANFSWRIGHRQLAKRSPFLRGLRESMMRSQVRYYSLWNPLDIVVFPGNSASWKHGEKDKRMFAPIHMTTMRWKSAPWVEQAIVESVDSERNIYIRR